MLPLPPVPPRQDALSLSWRFLLISSDTAGIDMQISRSSLYRLVSSSPLSKVAPTFGISASRLAAICRDNNVPYPGSGYWTRKSLNQPVELIPLPQVAGSDEAMITIERERPRVGPSRDRASDELVDPRRAPPSNATQAIENSHRHRLHAIIEMWVSYADVEKLQAKIVTGRMAVRAKKKGRGGRTTGGAGWQPGPSAHSEAFSAMRSVGGSSKKIPLSVLG